MFASSYRKARFAGLAMLLAFACSSPKKIDIGGQCQLNSDCNSPLVCSMGVCHSACVETRDCPAGQSCVKTSTGSVCQLPAEADCRTVQCLGGLVCAVDYRCRTPCQSAANCNTGQVCVSGVCADTTDVDTGGNLPQKNPNAGIDGGAGSGGADPGGKDSGPDSGEFVEVGTTNSTGGAAGSISGAGGSTGETRAGGAGAGGTTGTAGGSGAIGAGGTTGIGGLGGSPDAGLADLASGTGGTSGGGSGGAGAGGPDTATDRSADLAVLPDVPDDALAGISDTGPNSDSDDGTGASSVPTGCGSTSSTNRYFCDDFESGLSNWVVSGQDWNTTTAKSRSPTHSATDSPDGNYPAHANASLTMATSVDLTSATAPILSFWHQLYICSAYAGTGQTHEYVEGSSDGGLTWLEIDHWNNVTISTWDVGQFSLSSYAGKKVKLRFRLSSDTCLADGWYIDDVEIREAN